MRFEPPVQKVIDEFARLPGIGAKTAQRLAFHLMSLPRDAAERLGEAVLEMTEQVRNCSRCFNLTSQDLCSICSDTRRDHTLVCVVERPQDISVIERTNEFRGGYHVLGGALSPLRGIGPEQLRIPELERRMDTEGILELVMATNPTLEGDATALYLARVFKSRELRITRLASGLPVGGDLDYADEITLGRALAGRRQM
ncbi:MAG: recombination protein RecR [Acidimicrobiia bacterium]|nr:recombination mediator RecR [bacterium]MXX01654.1 recombination protein RecR [Acidimicrobiia bacterium]MDE0675123.1 recombination mediator RecR [bacterium]MXX45318.1 recombination protein RecR [Acidimicrobiia bacterium]MXY74935.1 recombination protein RecR [Acidimicrobiia bacterium]